MTIVSMPSVSSRGNSRGWLARFTDARNGVAFFNVALSLGYLITPVLVIWLGGGGEYYSKIIWICASAIFFVWLGSRLEFLDRVIRGQNLRLNSSIRLVIISVWLFFFLFVIVAWVTAEGIPLLVALSGADADTVAILREKFLKAREGWQSSFVYINAILTGALVPYSIALMFVSKHRLRWVCLGFFLLFSVSFVEKAFFLKALLPVLILVAQQDVRLPLSPSSIAFLILLVLGFVTFLSGAGTQELASEADFFSAQYQPQGAVSHLIWRGLAIPLVTAADSIRVFTENFDDHFLWGRTSGLIAMIVGSERVEFERLVFSAQWGQNETGTGSANSVYFVEAYVNWGWIGVALSSLFAGIAFRFFAKSPDPAFRALWPLWAFGLYTSGLIGMLLSNGFVLLFGVCAFVRLKDLNSRATASI